MKAVLTGGTGFIGGKLAAGLVARGYHVKCLVRRTSKVEELRRLGVELCYGDLSDFSSIKNAVRGGDIVYHLAAHVSDWGSKEEFYRVNVEGTGNMLRASDEMGVKRLVYLSTSTVLWKSSFWHINNLTDIDESYPYPSSYNDLYNETKAEAERLVAKYHSDAGLETVILRVSVVWGPGDTVILPRLARAAKRGILFLIGRGDRWVSPCYVENLVQALSLAGESERAAGNIYFINDGIRIKHEQFIACLLKTVGIDWSPGISVPYSLAYGLASLLELGARMAKSEKPPILTKFAVAALAGSRTYSIEKARRDLGYSPDVGFEQGLRCLGDWVESIGGIDKLLGTE